MKRGRTALTRRAHFLRACKKLGIDPTSYQRRMIKKPGVYVDEIVAVNSHAFGLGQSRKVSVLLVPELRKRRSERDQAVLAEQIKFAHIRLHDIKAGRVATN